MPPGCCIATLTTEDPQGFIDTGLDPATVDPRVYISVSWIKEMARRMGMIDGSELVSAGVRIVELEKKVADQEKFVESVRYTLSKLGEPLRNKPGRPRKTETKP
jgi:hypothetical protein